MRGVPPLDPGNTAFVLCRDATKLIAIGSAHTVTIILPCFTGAQHEKNHVLHPGKAFFREGAGEIFLSPRKEISLPQKTLHSSGYRTVPIVLPFSTSRMLSGWNRPNTRTIGTLFSAHRAKAALSMTLRRISMAFS